MLAERPDDNLKKSNAQIDASNQTKLIVKEIVYGHPNKPWTGLRNSKYETLQLLKQDPAGLADTRIPIEDFVQLVTEELIRRDSNPA